MHHGDHEIIAAFLNTGLRQLKTNPGLETAEQGYLWAIGAIAKALHNDYPEVFNTERFYRRSTQRDEDAVYREVAGHHEKEQA